MNSQNSFSFSALSNISSQDFLAKLLEQAVISVKDELQQFANKSSFTTDLYLALGENIEVSHLKESWQAGEVIFPIIEVVKSTEINNANGAFAKATNKIYLAEEFLLANINHLDSFTDILLEEYGHFVDSQLNVVDAPGDEGTIFAAVVRDKQLNKETLQQLKSEDDTAVVVLDGKEIEIEQSAVSSNGQNIAYLENNNRLFIQDLTSGNVINTGFEVSGIGNNETHLDLSADGKYIVFNSFKDYTNLGIGDINGFKGVPAYVYEIETGNIENINVISYPSLGEIAPGLEDYFDSSEQVFQDNLSGEISSAEDVTISGDGRYVAYSEINSLDPDYTDSIVIVDRISKEHILIPDGSDPTISGDGRYVAYEKNPGIYIYDKSDRSSTKIANVGNEPKISLNGNYIAYQDSGNLYFYDRLNQQSTKIYSNPNGRTNNYSITDDGRVAYYDSTEGIVVRDVANNTTKIIKLDGAELIGDTEELYGGLTISGDGQYAFFQSKSYNLTLANDKVVNIVEEAEFTKNPAQYLKLLRDFDGNDLGAADAWKPIGSVDVQGDGDIERVYINPVNGRWATVGTDITGMIDFSQHGQGGDTRVVGIYIDPLVEAGIVEKNSDFDSQRRFQNDLRIDNLTLIEGSGFDYDGDTLQEVYFKVNDGTAVLHALMHADGNIQYSNYQSQSDLEQFMTDHEITNVAWEDWF